LRGAVLYIGNKVYEGRPTGRDGGDSGRVFLLQHTSASQGLLCGGAYRCFGPKQPFVEWSLTSDLQRGRLKVHSTWIGRHFLQPPSSSALNRLPCRPPLQKSTKKWRTPFAVGG